MLRTNFFSCLIGTNLYRGGAVFSPSDTWEVAFVGRNLTDKMVLQHAYEIAGSNFVSFSRGRTLTFEALMRF